MLTIESIGTYAGVPDRATMTRLRRRVDRVITTNRVGVGKAVELTFDGDA